MPATSRSRFRASLLYLALAVSAIAHVMVYWVTPHFIRVWNAPTPSRFDAVLVAAVKEVVPIPTPTGMASSDIVVVPKLATPRPRKTSLKKAVPTASLTADKLASTRKTNEVDALENPEEANSPPIAAAPIEPVPDHEPAVVSAANTGANANASTAATSKPDLVAAAAPTSRAEPSSELSAPNFPSSINIDYKMTSSVANGMANLAWKRSGQEYEIDTSIQATGFFTSMFVGVFRQTSRGEVTSDGVRPNFFSLQRGDAGADTAEFKRATKELKIIKHGETHLSPLPERMQDMQSFLFQMAHDAALLKPSQEFISVQVTNARKVYEYKFKRIGEESIQTRLGALPTIHLKSEAADPEDVYEVWLSPQHFYMPVKLKFFMGRFPIEQVASSVRMSEPDADAAAKTPRK